MVKRSVNLLHSNSFFLFGARGVGKTKLVLQLLPPQETLYIDLLDPTLFDRYLTDPGLLLREIKELPADYRWIAIDEIQKVPKLLDVVHKGIESTKFLFALSGSSARKLKRAGANLLAGRAYTYKLFPFTHLELGDQFVLKKALTRGTLPKAYLSESDQDANQYLRSYVHTYLKEEIQVEQVVRRLEPFRRFLSVAAQMNGEIVNYSRIAQDVGTSSVTVQSYFSILEDTLLGYHLEAYHSSVRKRQREAPKFYFFDLGVQRALANMLTVPITTTTSEYGKAFEHFIILEMMRIAEYQQNDYSFSYLRTKDDAEIDLIVERPGKPLALVEIKSTEKVRPDHASTLIRFNDSFPKAESYLLSNDLTAQQIQGIRCLPWQQGLSEIFKA